MRLTHKNTPVFQALFQGFTLLLMAPFWASVVNFQPPVSYLIRFWQLLSGIVNQVSVRQQSIMKEIFTDFSLAVGCWCYSLPGGSR